MPPDFDPLGEGADPRRYVPLATSERILSDIAANIHESASPILLAGPSGVGKTLILHVLGENARLSGQRVVYSPFLHLDPDECARWLLHLLGIASDARPAEAQLLEELSSHGSRPTLLLVDEIQAAPEASVRKLAELARAGRPALTVVAAGSEGRHLRKRIPALAPEVMLRFPKELPDAEIGALYAAILERPELSPHVRQALSPERGEILRAASGLPGLLKAELDVRAENLAVRGGPRRRPIEELFLDTWMPPAPPPRRAPLRRGAAETIRAWAARGAVEAERLTESARRVVASSLGDAGAALFGAEGVALPAATLCVLVLVLNSHFFGLETRELAPIDGAPTAELASSPPPEATPLPSPTWEPAAPLPVQVQAQINARPWARIRIDGVDVGPTPLSRPLAPGVYRIEAEFADGRSLQRHVEIGPEQRFVALP